jgi:hypothetical protein
MLPSHLRDPHESMKRVALAPPSRLRTYGRTVVLLVVGVLLALRGAQQHSQRRLRHAGRRLARDQRSGFALLPAGQRTQRARASCCPVRSSTRCWRSSATSADTGIRPASDRHSRQVRPPDLRGARTGPPGGGLATGLSAPRGVNPVKEARSGHRVAGPGGGREPAAGRGLANRCPERSRSRVQ